MMLYISRIIRNNAGVLRTAFGFESYFQQVNNYTLRKGSIERTG